MLGTGRAGKSSQEQAQEAVAGWAKQETPEEVGIRLGTIRRRREQAERLLWQEQGTGQQEYTHNMRAMAAARAEAPATACPTRYLPSMPLLHVLLLLLLLQALLSLLCNCNARHARNIKKKINTKRGGAEWATGYTLPIQQEGAARGAGTAKANKGNDTKRQRRRRQQKANK